LSTALAWANATGLFVPANFTDKRILREQVDQRQQEASYSEISILF
jgi:hypothetical protein